MIRAQSKSCNSRKALRRDITPIRAGRGAFTASALQATKPKPQPGPDLLPEPAPMEDGRSRPPAQHGPPKRQAVEAPASVPHTLLQGLTKKPNPGQGDCLFHALEQAILVQTSWPYVLLCALTFAAMMPTTGPIGIA